MKRLYRLGTVAIAAALLALAGSASADIVGTDHDFSTKGWAGGQICEVCHTPHNSDTSVADAPLWNHEVTTATFIPYSSATLDAIVGQPNGISKLCLSCHDGTVALENFGGFTGGTNFVSGGALVGTDLTDDHPVSFTYDAALASLDGGLFDPTSQASGLGGTVDDDMLFSTQLECGSCHDPHGVPGVGKFLRKSNAASALCLTCHNK